MGNFRRATVERADTDPLVTLARRLLFLGMFSLPLLTVRLTHSLSVSDGIFALAAVVLLMSRRRAVVSAPSMWYFGSFLIVASGIAASFVAVSPLSSLQVVGNGIFVLFVWQWTTRTLLTDLTRVRRAITAVVLGCTLSAAVAILQSTFHVFGYRGASGGTEGARALGLTNQPNIAAVTFALGLIFALGLVLQEGRGRRGWRLTCVGVLALALILSASVSGMASALIGIFVLLARRGMGMRRLVAIAILLVGVYVAGVALEGNGNGGENLNPLARIEQTTGSGTGYNTVSPRIQTLKNAWTGIQQSPIIGHGVDQVSLLVYYDPYLATDYPAHDFPLLVWYGGGIFMLFGVAIAMATAFRRVLRRGRRDPTRDMILTGIVVVLFFSLQSPELFDRWLWLPFMLALTYRRDARPEAATAPHSRARLPVGT